MIEGDSTPGPDAGKEPTSSISASTIPTRRSTTSVVRQAIAMAIDRQRIVHNFYPPGSSVATSSCHPSSVTRRFAVVRLRPAWPSKHCHNEAVYDPTAASRRPSPTVTWCAATRRAQAWRPGHPGPARQININVKIEVMESGAFLDAATPAISTIYMLGWGADYPDATNFLDFHFGRVASSSSAQASRTSVRR